MHPNAALIDTFYRSFQGRDYRAMAACYHPQVVFSDPVFGPLAGARASAMWQMFCVGGTDIAITYSGVDADERQGHAAWEARYEFARTHRPVHNQITARFAFADGRIIRHQDSFDLWRWARMALGPTGWLAGWLPPVQGSIRRSALHRLDEFMRSPAYQPPAP
jgi:ketosteroid isomerase-like protein